MKHTLHIRKVREVNDKTKVLMLSENFFPLSTASAQRMFAYAKTLVLHSFEPIVITKSPISFKSEKITVTGLKCKKEIPIFDPVLCFLYLMQSIRVTRKYHPSLIISTVPKINNAIAGFFLSVLFRVPHIIDVRDYWETSLLSHPFDTLIPRQVVSLLIRGISLLYQQASSLITVNETLRRMLHKRGIPHGKIHVIPNGIDTSLFQPCHSAICVEKLRKKHKLPLSKLIFVYAGSLTQYYKVDVVLRGIRLLAGNGNFIFLIIGSPTLLVTNEKIRRIVEILGIKRNVRVMGPLSVEETAELLRCSDVGIIPLEDKDIWKCMTTVKLFAYLASGLPILASGPGNGELHEFFRKHKVGLFVEKPTPSNFSEGFRHFMQNKSKIKGISLRGRKIVEDNYNRYFLALKIIPIINNVLNTNHANDSTRKLCQTNSRFRVRGSTINIP